MHWSKTFVSSSSVSGSLPFLSLGLEAPCPEPEEVPEDEPDDDPEEEPDEESVGAPVAGAPVAGACPVERGLLLVAIAAKTIMRRMTRMATTMPMIKPAWDFWGGGIVPTEP